MAMVQQAVPGFCPYVAQRKIVCLGYGEEQYLAQQSIRTFSTSADPASAM